MKLTIITICYNNKDGLANTIKSIKSQTWKEFEWIIIDGGSTDGSLEIIKHSGASFWCSETDRGPYDAMNKGVMRATGEYVIFMNSGDTFYEPETLIKVFSKKIDSDVIYGDALRFSADGSHDVKKEPSKMTLAYLYHYNLIHQSAFIKRILLLSNPYDLRFRIVADLKLWIQLILLNHSFTHCGEIVSRYNTDGISSMKNYQIVQKEREEVITELLHPSIKEILNVYLHRDVKKTMSFLRKGGIQKFFVKLNLKLVTLLS